MESGHAKTKTKNKNNFFDLRKHQKKQGDSPLIPLKEGL